MSKVYVVTSGCWEDFRVACVFSKKELADDYIEKYSPDSDINNTYLEYELNPVYDVEGKIPFEINMTDEEITNCESALYYPLNAYIDLSKNIKGESSRYGEVIYHRFIIFAETREEAIDIALKRKDDMIADNTWYVESKEE